MMRRHTRSAKVVRTPRGFRFAAGWALFSLFFVLLASSARAESSDPEGWSMRMSHEIMSPYCPGRTLANCPSGEAEELTRSDHFDIPSSWSVDGVLAFVDSNEYDIWVLAVDEKGAAPRPLLQSPARETHPAFSPNGAWLAYASDETGQEEVYVRPYPGPGPAVRVSVDGGIAPAWSRDGRELFYNKRRTERWIVEVTAEETFTRSTPRLLFAKNDFISTYPERSYDVTPEGTFVMILDRPLEPQPVTQMHVILNWFEELKERVPTGGR